jgi:threonine dehydrogenase-like Zn-dependent dehydrogenase
MQVVCELTGLHRGLGFASFSFVRDRHFKNGAKKDMKALALTPTVANSAQLMNVPEPPLHEGALLCEMIAIGVCGTDHELLAGDYGSPPDGNSYLILGHESLGRVVESSDPQYKIGDHVVGVVRRPDPLPCTSCAAGEWDMCENGLYTERGIYKRHGYCSEKFRLEPEFAISVDKNLKEAGVLLEPTSIVAKAWEQCERIFSRSTFRPRRVLITGAGPVGLLAAMIGRQKGYDVHVVDRIRTGPKPQLVKDLGATYHDSYDSLRKSQPCFDLTIECTGAPALITELMSCIARNGILCLSGVSSRERRFDLDIGALNREIVLENEVIFGTVNANLRHFELAAQALANADLNWLRRLITRKVHLSQWPEAFRRIDGDIKTIITMENI